jgi:hypothetical protein
MNKSILLNILIFTLGGGVGFLVGKKVYENYYAAIAQEEIDSVKEAFENRRLVESGKPGNENGMTDEEYRTKNLSSEFDGDPDKTPNGISEYNKQRTNTNSLTRSSTIINNSNEQAKMNYHLVSAKPQTETDEPLTDAAGKTEEEMDLSKVDRTRPYIIDDREFNDEFEHHDKISLYYYAVDDVLCDEDEEVIKDIDNTVGFEALEAFDRQTTVWVRNEPLTIDYEIICINKSYAESVGKVESPRERYLKEKGREKGEE